jgi:hypothetical protein
LHKNLLYELHWIVGAKIYPKRKKRTLMMDWIILGFFVSGPLFSQKSSWVGGFNLSQLYEFLIGWFDFVAHRLDQYAHC